MSDVPPSRRRRWVWLLAVSAPGLAVAALAVADQVNVHLCRARIRNQDPLVRTRALYAAAADRERRVADAVLAVLEHEQDRTVLEAAAYAAMRIQDPRGVPVLQRRADEGPDDFVRAKLIGYAARLSRRHARLVNWLIPGTESSEPWQRVGSAAGLLEIGQPRGGTLLIDMLPQLDPELRAYAIEELQAVAEPMAEAVGWPHDWAGAEEGHLDDAQYDNLRAFWDRHGTIELLNDVLTRLERRDPKWHEVSRLLHARDRIKTWFD